MNQKQSFYNHPHTKILSMLVLSSIFSITVLAFRMYYTETFTFKFLVWNLFLAWIPYFISLSLLLWGDKIRSWFLISILLIIWLLFFPNSPYIITDLFHFDRKPIVPRWYDLILIYSFAWNGIMLGFLSLLDLHNWLRQRINEFFGWLFVFFSLFLGSFGIYLGRYERFNSWDVVTNPFQLTNDILGIFALPFSKTTYIALSVTVLFSAFLLIAYLTLRVISLTPKPLK